MQATHHLQTKPTMDHQDNNLVILLRLNPASIHNQVNLASIHSRDIHQVNQAIHSPDILLQDNSLHMDMQLHLVVSHCITCY